MPAQGVCFGGNKVLISFRRLYNRHMKSAEDKLPGRPLDLDELEKFPERGIDVLKYCSTVSFWREFRANPDPRWRELHLKLEEEWMDARQPLTRKKADRLLDELMYTHEGGESLRILGAAGKRGRPVKLRKAAIMALMRRRYLDKPWKEITLQVCPCGQEHTGDRVEFDCKPKLQVVVRILKRLLRELKITLPETPRVFASDSTRNIEEWTHPDPEALGIDFGEPAVGPDCSDRDAEG